MRKLSVVAAIAASFMLLSGASAQTKIALGQLPNCAITSTTPSSMPIILAIIPSANGVSQFGCFTLAGVTINAATATSPATITIPGTIAVNLPAFVDGEAPSGPINGTNAVFSLASAPAPSVSLQLYRNGLLQQQPGDYTLTGAAITFTATATPQVGDTLQASYRH